MMDTAYPIGFLGPLRKWSKSVVPANNRIVRHRYENRENNEVVEFSVSHQNIRSTWDMCVPHAMQIRRAGGLRTELAIKIGEERMIKAITLSICLAASSLSLSAAAQDVRPYSDGPVTHVAYIHVDYGNLEKYIDWLNSTWKPTMEATKKAGLIIDYKVFSFTPIGYTPNQPNVILWITYKNMAALDKGAEEEDVAKKVIGSTEFQNKARIGRNDYREVLGSELIRELVLK